jgi:hypothetical protein
MKHHITSFWFIPFTFLYLEICFEMHSRFWYLNKMPSHTYKTSTVTIIYTFGVLRPLLGDQIKLPLPAPNTRPFFRFSSHLTATTCFDLSSDHLQVFLQPHSCMLHVWLAANTWRWSYRPKHVVAVTTGEKRTKGCVLGGVRGITWH